MTIEKIGKLQACVAAKVISIDSLRQTHALNDETRHSVEPSA